jgi:hypothetical protein
LKPRHRRNRRKSSRPEGLSGFQCRSGRRSSRTFPSRRALEVVEPAGRAGELDSFFASIPAVLRHQGDEAYYEPVADRVTMPPCASLLGLRPLLRDARARAVALDRSCQPPRP